MDVFKQGNLTWFIIFFIPGFVSLKIYDWLVPGQRRDFSQSVVEAVGFSSLNFAFFFWWLIPLAAATDMKKVPSLSLGFQLFIIGFVFPALWPLIYVKGLSR